MTSASVPLATPTASPAPRKRAASSSNAFTSGPRMKLPESSTSAILSFSSSRSGAYCALTSVNGIATGPLYPSVGLWIALRRARLRRSLKAP